MSRMLAIDFGTKRVGVAVSDETALIARPLAVLAAVPRDRLVRELGAIVAAHAPGTIVVGRPRRSRGEPGSRGMHHTPFGKNPCAELAGLTGRRGRAGVVAGGRG